MRGSVAKSCKIISRVKHHKQRIMLAPPARLRAPRPKPLDIHTVGIRFRHVCMQNLMAVAAPVSMSDDTKTGKLWRTCHRTVSRNCFGISVTPIFNRQNSSDRLSAGLVLASATFSGPGTLLVRTFLLAVSACKPQKSLVQMTEPLQTSSACHTNGARAVGTQMDVHVLSTSQEQSLYVLRFTRGCGGRDVLSFT